MLNIEENNITLSVKRVGNHWYPCINHDLGYLCGFDEKSDRYLSVLDYSKNERLTFEFEELHSIVEGINIIYFNEEDIVRYLMTDDSFDLRVTINGHEFTISSDLYWLLENQFNFNFHKSLYKIHVY